MAITYQCAIPQMNAHIQEQGEDNVIYTVHYRYTASESIADVTYYDTAIGTQNWQVCSGKRYHAI